MKRAFPQKVKSVSRYSVAADVTVGQPKQAASGVNRRVRTSAAMVGLALSMGASNLLIPRQNDGAAAAESQATESTTAPQPEKAVSLPLATVAEMQSAATVPMADRVNHVVRPGQTLWQIARRYHVGLQVLAAANDLTPNAILHIGQILEIPTRDSLGVSASAAEASSRSTSIVSESLERHQIVTSANSSDADRQLKAQQDGALSRLRQTRQSLRDSLVSLRSESPDAAVVPQKSPEPIASRTVDASPIAQDASHQASAAETTSEPLTYRVKPGDTLGSIAHTYRVTRRELAAVNHLANPNRLRDNQSLVIPQAHTSDGDSIASSTPAASSSAAVTPAAVTPATVTPAATVMAVVPRQAEVRPEASASATVYRVGQGDTLGHIAHLYDVSPAALASVNRLSSPNRIAVNQVLTIPNRASSTASSIETAAIAPPVSSSAAVSNQTQIERSAPEAIASAPDSALSQYYSMVTVPTVPVAGSVPSAGEIAVVPPVAPGDAVPAESLPDSLPQSLAISPANIAPADRAGSTNLSGSDAQGGSNPYVQHLMTEILSLRDRYRSEAAQGIATPQPAVVATAPIAQPVPAIGAEASPNASALSSQEQFTQAFQAEVRRLQEQRQVRQPVATDAPAPAPVTATSPDAQVVAVAPLGSENYEPLLQPDTGRIVSPDLPPLAGAEAYLPESTPAFNGYRWPTHGVITSGYGWRWGRLHAGIDIGAPIGTPVVAAAGGEVVFAGWNSGGYGNMVDIRHPDGSVTRYAHNSRLLVRAGQQVDQGQQISLVGSTGYSTGPHLHFEVHPAGQGAVNPIAYLPRSRG